MKKTLFLAATVLAGLAASSCGSDNDDNKKKDSGDNAATVAVEIATNLTFGDGDEMYLCDAEDGSSRRAVSVLRYDAAAGTFKGSLSYFSKSDAVRAFVRRSGSASVRVDTAACTITVDYRGQSGSRADAQSRDFAYSRAMTAAQIADGQSPRITLYTVSAFARIQKSAGLNAGSYRLTSSLNTDSRMASRDAAAYEYPNCFVAVSETSMLTGSMTPRDYSSLSIAPSTSDGAAYAAFYAQTVDDPVVESRVTLASGVNVITSAKLTGAAESESNGTVETDFVSGSTYTAEVTGTVEAGTLLCDPQFNPVAIVYDTNVSQGDYHTARAMALADSGSPAAWYTGTVIPSSASKYVTSSPATDMSGYATSQYFHGDASYTAINLAANGGATLRGCSSWYLPAAGEWAAFWNNLGGAARINKLLRRAGASQLADTRYWTSSLASLTEPVAVMAAGGGLATVPQPIRSQNAVRASILF